MRARARTGFGEVLVGAAEVGGVAVIGDLADVLGCAAQSHSLMARVPPPPLITRGFWHAYTRAQLARTRGCKREATGSPRSYRQTPRRGQSRGTRCSRPRAPPPTAT